MDKQITTDDAKTAVQYTTDIKEFITHARKNEAPK
jgi:hypothetical protein